MSTSLSTTPHELSPEARDILFSIARQAIRAAFAGNMAWEGDARHYPPELLQPGATFVTLYTRGELHGCIGSVFPQLPLYQDVAKNAVSAAFKDPRFPPLEENELDDTAIEISVLSPLQPLSYRNLDDLAQKIRPHVDGVMVERGWHRGLLLPQVWEKLPDPYEFLQHVALKANAPMSIYEHPDTTVSVFQVRHYLQPAPNESKKG
ncbi:MAG: AmmeMemoRadiSam system protein A [Chloroflexi bacterium]|nr:AmmeMemoRadiSam system protein A [Chloroflexota bacterium]